MHSRGSHTGCPIPDESDKTNPVFIVDEIVVLENGAYLLVVDGGQVGAARQRFAGLSRAEPSLPVRLAHVVAVSASRAGDRVVAG